nr:PREDICTED: glucosylceramidase-like [Anolis carolinensis]|eukprot:XP_016854371.1 PREDICTED: glucosylceramidase-like [Anolis carolinensis]
MKTTGTILGVLVLLVWTVAETTTSRPCAPRFLSARAMVCVCNATYCDTMDPVSIPAVGRFVKYESTSAGGRLERSEGVIQPSTSGSGLRYTYNPFVHYQRIKGFGGSLTDAAAINIMRLSPAAQDHLLRSYFSEEGKRGCFYLACKTPGVLEVEIKLTTTIPNFPSPHLPSLWQRTEAATPRPLHYAISARRLRLAVLQPGLRDTDLRIPLLHRFVAAAKRHLSLIGSPWSAPGWLRTNNQVMGKARLKGEPGDIHHKTWARYFVRFLDEYACHNVTFWAVTAQNEPSSSVFIPMKNFPMTQFSPEKQRDFIIADLGPALAASRHKDVLLIIHDDQRIHLPNWANVVIGNSSAARYVAGIGIHWYLDSVTPPELTLEATYLLFPDFFLLYTESCNGFRVWEPRVDLGSWERGVRYSQNILTNLNSFIVGWIDWNLVLDMEGGPNYVKNHVDSPIIVNPLRDEFYKQPMFYHLAHFSKFIPEGSIRVAMTKNFEITGCQLQSTGFVRPDGIAVVVVLNK